MHSQRFIVNKVVFFTGEGKEHRGEIGDFFIFDIDKSLLISGACWLLFYSSLIVILFLFSCCCLVLRVLQG